MAERSIGRREVVSLLAAWPAVGSAQDQGVHVADETWHDSARGRDVPVRLRLPGTSGAWPVVLYSHGLGGSRFGGDAWGKAWQAAGMAVVHLQHAGSDVATFIEGGVARLRAAGNARQLLARVADVRFVIDEIERRQRRAAASPWGQADLQAIGLAGHSFGALTVQAVAGQRYPVPANLRDERVAAFIALSPSVGRYNMPVEQQFAGVERPFMAATGSLDGDPFGTFADGAPRARIYEGLPAGRRALLWLDGADHMTLAGNAERRIAGRGPFARQGVAQQREAAHHVRVARIGSLWWQARLAGDAAAAAALKQPLDLADADRFTLG